MEQSGDIGRMSALDAGYDMKASGVTLDRFCGSGITSANIAAASVKAGLEDLVVHMQRKVEQCKKSRCILGQFVHNVHDVRRSNTAAKGA